MAEAKESITRFWQGCQEALPQELRNRSQPEAWAFGLGAKMADELGELTAQGVKQATASLVWEYEAEGSALPQPGDLSIILDGRGEPLCLIITVAVEVKPFIQVDEQFAFDEGEGDRSLAFWRNAHWRFFKRTCEAIGRKFSEDMPVVCERFLLLWPQLPSNPTCKPQITCS